jgi:hypothetical protein
VLDFLIRRGMGRGLVRYLKETRVPLITTFYAPAIIADRGGCDSYRVVTDAHINRVWAPMDGRTSRIDYFAPSTRGVRRLAAYGVPRSRVALTASRSRPSASAIANSPSSVEISRRAWCGSTVRGCSASYTAMAWNERSARWQRNRKENLHG